MKLYGEDIRKYNATFLKDTITYIGQKPDFITATIFENIALGRVTSKEEIQKVWSFLMQVNLLIKKKTP